MIRSDHARLDSRERVRRQVAVILSMGGTTAALAAKALVSGPIGMVAKSNRPGGNVTGVNFMRLPQSA